MSFYDYRVSRQIDGEQYPFYALIMAAMRRADSINSRLLQDAYPEVWQELQLRYNAPGGALTEAEAASL